MVRYSITDSIGMNLGKIRDIVKDREAWHAAVHEVTESEATQRLNNKMGRVFTLCLYSKANSDGQRAPSGLKSHTWVVGLDRRDVGGVPTCLLCHWTESVLPEF